MPSSDAEIEGLNMTFSDTGGSLLHKACIAQNMEAAVYLTNAGIDTTVSDKKGRTADQVCFTPQIQSILPDGQKGQKSKSISTTRNKIGDDGFVLSKQFLSGLPRRKPLPTAHDKEKIFDMAKNERDVDELMIKLQSLDFDVNAEKNCDGDYLIHIAVRQGLPQLPLLTLLQKNYKANIELRNDSGMTCLMMAALDGNTVLVDSLLCILGANPNTPHTESGWTALHYACHSNQDAIVSNLIKRGADFNQEDQQGARPDDIAVLCGHDDCCQVIILQRQQRVSTLMDLTLQDKLVADDIKSSDLYTTDEQGYTLLMASARYNSLHSLKVLLTNSQAPVNAQHQKTLETAVAMAAREGHQEIVNSLINHGALLSIRDLQGELPLQRAVEGEHLEVVKTLLQHQQALTGLCKALRIADHAEIYQEVKVAMNRRQRELVTPALFECAMTGDAGRLYCLLEEGDNVNPTSGGGDWPLSLAVENGHLEVVMLLIQWGGDYTRRHPATHNTVLHMACARGHVQVLSFLLDHIKDNVTTLTLVEQADAMVNALNLEKKTPLILAADKGYIKAVRLLLAHGATTAVLDPTGHLYKCEKYQGVQYFIDQHRCEHTNNVMALIRQRRNGLKKLEQIFLPRFDHNLRDSQGDTPLMAACSHAKRDIVQFLLMSATYSLATSSTSGSLDISLRESELDSGAGTTDHNTTHSGGQSHHSSHHKGKHKKGQQEDKSSHNAPLQATQSAPEHLNVLPTSISRGDSKEMDIHSAEDVLKSLAADCERPGDLAAAQANHPPDDGQLHDNIPTLLESIMSLHNGSVYVSSKAVNHICAVNTKDGSTCLHKLVSAGDHVSILTDILEHDHSAVNIQDNKGLSVLHLACKLDRRKCVEKLTSFPFVDLNCRTLDGKLPEEMTTNQHLNSLIRKHREQHPSLDPAQCPWRSFPTSIFGGAHTMAFSESSIDFDKLNARFMMMKQHGCDYESYL